MTDAFRREVLQSVLAGVTLPAADIDGRKDLEGGSNVPDLGAQPGDDMIWIAMAATLTDCVEGDEELVETYTYIWRMAEFAPESDRTPAEVRDYIRGADRGEYDDEVIKQRAAELLNEHELP